MCKIFEYEVNDRWYVIEKDRDFTGCMIDQAACDYYHNRGGQKYQWPLRFTLIHEDHRHEYEVDFTVIAVPSAKIVSK
jgi:hypothetical protein